MKDFAISEFVCPHPEETTAYIVLLMERMSEIAALLGKYSEAGATYLAQAQKDAESSGVNGVTNTPPSDQTGGDEFLAALQGVGKKQ